ncbi:UvrD-helicase domain-containing protein [Xenorhabdus sp. XENO-1]|uniref:UvrD-helicase domain-containing protein n=1 Tax=Xenorhabdus bovienii TaxID=40576 RepID=UPI0020CA778D|nr:UvrD-helicase domain-containing protein [Xenorhabdus bovienii]MCP9269965.1 UvrD-helicase domain-containing protein [Xenorhabdus bovienii subsp. africana]
MIEINDTDISIVEKELSVSFDTKRQQIIKSFDDVQACPGSGKTTMVAAKLLIIARKWDEAHQGICVLTHTNVAKKEIINRLQHSTYGQKLLSRPHFIGTIQEFVNKFLAIPYLRSFNFSINQIDDEACCTRGWPRLKKVTKNYLERRHISSIQDLQYNFVDGELKLAVPGFQRQSSSDSYKDLQSVKKGLMEDGFFYYREMYAFANQYILKNLEIKNAIRSRFPIVFIDEMQDTQKFQDNLLNDIFSHEGVNLQRFGDPDQEIYATGEEGNQSYNQIVLEKIENSHRFSNSIALLAKNLSYNRINLRADIEDHDQTLHTIFLVDDNSRKTVLIKFAELCSQTIPDNCKDPIKTVGAVGQKKDNGLTICSYVESFNKAHSETAFKPSKLIHYFYESNRIKTSHESYRLIIDGLVRCARIANSVLLQKDGLKTSYSATNIRKFLKESGVIVDFNMLIRILIKNDISEEEWGSTVTRLLGYIELQNLTLIEEFIGFDSDNKVQEDNVSSSSNQIYTNIRGRTIKNEVNTIHAVKGETHAATLVLETKYYSNDLSSLIDYILAENTTQPTGARKIQLMKQAYVAFSRPKHLLCLAMNKSGFPEKHAGKQEYAGWKICDLTLNKS